MSEELSIGVKTLIERMESHPEEFFDGGNGRWGFMYKEIFRDVMSEPEKASLHVALKKVRRMEFDAKVVKELMRDEIEEEELEEVKSQFERAKMNISGQNVRY